MRAFALSCLLSIFVSPLSAQVVHGRVLDVTSGEPLVGALVIANGEESDLAGMAMTDDAGGFRLQVPADQEIRLEVERLGYATSESVPLVFTRSDSLQLEIRLRPKPIALEGIVASTRSQLNRNVSDFLDRKKSGFGLYMGPDKIAKIQGNSATQVVLPVGSRLFTRDRTLLARSFPTALSGGPVMPVCAPQVYVDGTHVNAMEPGGGEGGTSGGRAVNLDAWVSADEIRAVEYYEDPFNAPAQFQTPFVRDCPVVVIWTESGFGLSGLRGLEWWERGGGR